MLLSYISDHLMTHLRSDILISYSFLHLMDTHTHTHTHTHTFSSFHSLSCVQLFVTPGTTARQTSMFITNSQSPPKHMSIESVMPSNHLILCCPHLLLPFFPASGSFPMSQLSASSGQNIAVSASTSVPPMNTQD